MVPEQSVIDKWSGAAPFWEKHRETIRTMFAPVTDALVEAAQIGRGDRVLDVATGPGEPAVTVAAEVGPEGSVVGVDPIEGMVAAARRAAERAGLTNTLFETGSADELRFPTDSFDAVVCRFGAMFFPSPVEGLREMGRVLKPGRKAALAVWGLAEENPFFYVFARVVDRYVSAAPVTPEAQDAFRFATPGKLVSVLEEAGFRSAQERVLRVDMRAALAAEDFWTLRWEMSERLRERVAALSAEQLAAVRRESIEALGEYARDGGISLPATVLIVSGTKG